MKVENYSFPPKSSFLSTEKDTALIVREILKNERLKKLLYRNEKYCLSDQCPNLDKEETLELLDNHILLVPKLKIDKNIKTYLVISFDDFVPNAENPQYRDSVITFEVICHFDYWNLGDFQLRPYKIAGELDSMFNEKVLTGLGHVQFLGANQQNYNSEFGGLILMYSAIHGKEDVTVEKI